MRDIEIKKIKNRIQNKVCILLVLTLLTVSFAPFVVSNESGVNESNMNTTKSNVTEANVIKRINEIEGDLRNFSIDVDGATSKLNSIKKEINDIKNKLDKDKLKEKVNVSKIDELVDKVNNIREDIKTYNDFKNEKNDINQKLEYINTNVETPSGFNNEYENLRDIRKDIENLKKEFNDDDTMKKDIKQIEGEWDNKKKELDKKLDGTIGNKNNELDGLLGEENNLLSEINDLNVEKTNAEKRRNDAIFCLIKSIVIPLGVIFFILGVITIIILEKRRESKIKHDFGVDKWNKV